MEDIFVSAQQSLHDHGPCSSSAYPDGPDRQCDSIGSKAPRLLAPGGTVLPPGFRFHPTDEELLVHYLRRKASAHPLPAPNLITEINLYKFDPWDLPAMASFGEQEWYFFSPRERKYPNGARPNRAAASGYWKATGTDKLIHSSNGSHDKLGVKKSLVFYIGKPPKGTKTDWVMHEYRLTTCTTDMKELLAANGTCKSSSFSNVIRKPYSRLDDWVLCRIYSKPRSNLEVQVTSLMTKEPKQAEKGECSVTCNDVESDKVYRQRLSCITQPFQIIDCSNPRWKTGYSSQVRLGQPNGTAMSAKLGSSCNDSINCAAAYDDYNKANTIRISNHHCDGNKFPNCDGNKFPNCEVSSTNSRSSSRGNWSGIINSESRSSVNLENNFKIEPYKMGSILDKSATYNQEEAIRAFLLSSNNSIKGGDCMMINMDHPSRDVMDQLPKLSTIPRCLDFSDDHWTGSN